MAAFLIWYVLLFSPSSFILHCSWLPFLSSVASAQQVLHRLFPFARGLYEVQNKPSFYF